MNLDESPKETFLKEASSVAAWYESNNFVTFYFWVLALLRFRQKQHIKQKA